MTFKKRLWPILLLIAGCGEPYGVNDVGEDARFQRIQSSAISDGRLSPNSAQYLRHAGLATAFEKNPREVIDAILSRFGEHPSRSAAFVLAELCFIEGKRHAPTSQDAGQCYLTSALFAYAFLFDERLEGDCGPFDRRLSIAGETYNRALSLTLARHPLHGENWVNGAAFQTLVGPIRITGQTWKLPWTPAHIDRFECAYRYAITGIDDPAYQDGLGVPLIAIQSADKSGLSSELSAFQQPMPTHVLPASLCVRFHGSVVEAVRNRAAGLTADDSVLDPYTDESIDIAGRAIPLESDLITPLAYSIEHAPKLSGFKGLMNTDSWGDRHGLFMGHPYQMGKIPVVFVYGLTGKPTTWTLMFNHLVSNPVLRSRFQFWYFMYPTGNPVLYSAAELRGQLIKARQMFDPQGNDPTFNQMVVVGHSMGGLVTRLQVTDSGDELWNAVMQRPFDDAIAADENGKLIKSVFFFKSHPFIRRVIFMATPHRGSALADSRFARRMSTHVKLSDDVRIAADKLFAEPTTRAVSGVQAHTAVQSLSAENPVLQAVDRIPIPQRTTYHSIIANRDAANQTGGTDSIVPYTSSHLDGAASEIIIHSKHSCTRNFDAIREVERVLLLHLAEIDAGKN